MKVRIVIPANEELTTRVDRKGIFKRPLDSAIVSKVSIQALKREKCKDSEEEKWHKLREEHLTAGTIKNFIPKQMIGAEQNGKRRKDAYLSLVCKKERMRQRDELRNNPYCIHGKTYQEEAASVYSALMGATLTPIGCLTGPLEKEGEYPSVPEFISGTLDYIDLYNGIIIEIKCPQRIHKNWRDLYWAQCQIQMQLARCSVLHLFQYVPPMRDQRGQCQLNVIQISHGWFGRVMKSLCERAKYLPLKFSSVKEIDNHESFSKQLHFGDAGLSCSNKKETTF